MYRSQPQDIHIIRQAMQDPMKSLRLCHRTIKRYLHTKKKIFFLFLMSTFTIKL